MEEKDSISLTERYRQHYLTMESIFFRKSQDEPRKFVETIANYANTINQGYDHLLEANNMVCAVHLQRMLADVCLKAYMVLLLDESQKVKFFHKFLSGDRTNNIKVDGQQLTTRVLQEKISVDYPDIAAAYSEANEYVHFSKYYYHDFLGEDEGEDYSNIFSPEAMQGMLQTMINLNDTLVSILYRIRESYDTQFPFGRDPESGLPLISAAMMLEIKTDENGKYAECWITLEDAKQYIDELLENINALAAHQQRKAVKFGWDVQKHLESTTKRLVDELNRCGHCAAVIKKITEAEGEDALSNYQVLWMLQDVEYVEGYGEQLGRIELPTPETMHYRKQENFDNLVSDAKEIVAKDHPEILPDYIEIEEGVNPRNCTI